MKIACIGNMNNMLFQIGRYLIDDGHDLTFYMLDEYDHFLPKADTLEDIKKYNIITLGWNFDVFNKITVNQIKSLFSHYDYLIGTDLAPAFLFKAGLKLNLYVPHGSDLYEYPFARYRNNPPQLWEIAANLVTKAQFLGIKEADVVSLDESDDVYEIPYSKIRTKLQKRVSTPPFLYFKQYTPNYPTRSSCYNQFLEIRNEFKFIVFQQISQDWSMRGDFKIDKGNNHLITGFYEYLKQNPDFKKDSLLILMEYGADVEKSKGLIAELGIENNVKWFAKMYRKDLMALIHMCDICVGELGYREWYSYSSIMEFMAMKKPLIHHRGDAFYKAKGLELYPMVDAKSAEEVAQTFIDYRLDNEKYIQMGILANQWILMDAEKKLKIYKDIITVPITSHLISRFYLKKITYYLNNHILYNKACLGFYNFKASLKKIWQKS